MYIAREGRADDQTNKNGTDAPTVMQLEGQKMGSCPTKTILS